MLRLLAAGGVALSPLFGRLGAEPRAATSPYGPISPRPALDDGRTLLALPQDFQYRIVSSYGQLMDDAIATPNYFDGMAAFDDPAGIRLVRNHEEKEWRSFPLRTDEPAYDRHGGGGAVTMLVDRVSRRLSSARVGLNGTVANCGGGRTPWGTWISAEETVVGRELGFEKAHGYCFEVSPSVNVTTAAEPLRAMGRFRHEAVAIDPRTSVAYLTKDEGGAGFYRFVPTVPGRYSQGGRLQMLSIVGARDYDTRRRQQVGQSLRVTWVDIPEPDPLMPAAEPQPVYRQGRDRGAARFGRLEGAVFVDDSIYFSSTSGGDAGLGQVWRYRPYVSPSITARRRATRQTNLPEAEGELTLLLQPTSLDELKAPDNLCVTPRKSVLICEDAGVGVQRLRVLTKTGEMYDLAANAFGGFEHIELTGATFSPDGQTLFVNIFDPGLTLAIWGPWSRGPI